CTVPHKVQTPLHFCHCRSTQGVTIVTPPPSQKVQVNGRPGPATQSDFVQFTFVSLRQRKSSNSSCLPKGRRSLPMVPPFTSLVHSNHVLTPLGMTPCRDSCVIGRFTWRFTKR